MAKRLPKRLKKLRADLRLVMGRGKYDEAHEFAARIYCYELEDRRTDRRRKREVSNG